MSRTGWINEKNYNKARGGDCHKVLVGNWQEEQVLEGDMMGQGLSLDTTRKLPNSNRIAGGFESTAYLLSPEDPANRTAANLTTTQRACYNSENGDVAKLRKQALGVRSQLRAQQIVEQAKSDFSATQAEREEQAVPMATTSTYREQLGGDFMPKRSVTGYDASYLDDTPITLYTKNAVSGKQMTVQGGTMPSAVNSTHSRNTQFSNPKYML